MSAKGSASFRRTAEIPVRTHRFTVSSASYGHESVQEKVERKAPDALGDVFDGERLDFTDEETQRGTSRDQLPFLCSSRAG
jgi:hypothetical protein